MTTPSDQYSVIHEELQPSPDMVFPSSHSSPVVVTPFPHIGGKTVTVIGLVVIECS